MKFLIQIQKKLQNFGVTLPVSEHFTGRKNFIFEEKCPFIKY